MRTTLESTNVSIADVLDLMADYLDNIGWKQGGFGQDGYPRCAVGAMESVVDGVTSRDDGGIHSMGQTSYVKAYNGVYAYLCKWLLKNVYYNDPIAWNDGAHTKKPDVVDGLREAAADWRLNNE